MRQRETSRHPRNAMESTERGFRFLVKRESKGRVVSWLPLVFGLIPILLSLGGSAGAVEWHVSVQNFQFVPAALNITPGDSVTFTNEAPGAHDVSFEDGVNSGPTGSFETFDNWSRTFGENGTFRYRCKLHSTDFGSGMVGVVIVGTQTAAPPSSPQGSGFLPDLGAEGASLAMLAAVMISRGASRPRTKSNPVSTDPE